jgi:hypothetical protein
VTLIDHHEGSYRFLPGVEPFSSGVVAMDGAEIVRVTLKNPVPYRQGFDTIDQHLARQSRPRAALCAVELRSPAPFSFEGFRAFNQEYQRILSDWDILVNGQNPIARTNVAPAVRPPDEPVLYAFSYTVPCGETPTTPTFIIAGAGEVRSQSLSPAAVVRYGETSPDALQEKAAQVMYILSKRLERLNVTWAEAMAASIYTVHPLQSFLVSEILDVIGQASIHGVHWYYSHPPVQGLEFEMDLRGVRRELRL